jgi:hypothetical protein
LPSALTHKTKAVDLYFTYLPGFAKHILEHYVDEFVLGYIQLAREVKLPLLHFFHGLTEEQLLAISRERAVDYLQSIATNNLLKTLHFCVLSEKNYYLVCFLLIRRIPIK